VTLEEKREIACLVADELEARGLVAARRAKATPGVVLSDVDRLRRLGMRPSKGAS
jgi:hypothetical protein